jgi:hypothetical protein
MGGDLIEENHAFRTKSPPFRHREARQRRGDLFFVCLNDEMATALRASP